MADTDDVRYRRQLGARIRALRNAQGLSQAALGARAGVTGKFVGEVERGGNLTISTLVALSSALNVQPQDLTDSGRLEVATGRRVLTTTDLEAVDAAIQTLVRVLGPFRRRRY